MSSKPVLNFRSAEQIRLSCYHVGVPFFERPNNKSSWPLSGRHQVSDAERDVLQKEVSALRAKVRDFEELRKIALDLIGASIEEQKDVADYNSICADDDSMPETRDFVRSLLRLSRKEI